jgi:hypothetical protein
LYSVSDHVAGSSAVVNVAAMDDTLGAPAPSTVVVKDVVLP